MTTTSFINNSIPVTYANLVLVHCSSADLTLDFVYRAPNGEQELKARVVLPLIVGKELLGVLSTAFPVQQVAVVTGAN